MKIQCLGQAGFVISSKAASIAIDPYLSDSVESHHPEPVGRWARAFRPPIRTDGLSNVDAFLITHAHGDHCDIETLVPASKRNAKAIFVAPRPAIEKLRGAGIPEGRLVEALVDKRTSVTKEISFTAIPAAHYDIEVDPNGRTSHCGYIIEVEGKKIYHAGDTIVYDGLKERLLSKEIDIIILPINGRDAKREACGIVGNMTIDEAVELANASGAKMFIPMHNDMFEFNSVSEDEVRNAAKNLGFNVSFITLKPTQFIEFLTTV